MGGQRLYVLGEHAWIFKIGPRNMLCLLCILAADKSNMHSKCIMAYQHTVCQPGVFNTWAQPGLTRHGRILSECESNLYCFKESLHIMSQGKGSTQGRMFLIKKKKEKKKIFHARGKNANGEKKSFLRHLLWLLDKGRIWALWVFITWSHSKDSRAHFK